MPLGAGGSPGLYRDPFFRSGSYRQPGTAWEKTPAIGGVGGYLDRNQAAGYTRWLGDQGIGLGTPGRFAEFARGQLGNTITGHLAALAENPELSYMEYLNSIGGLDRLYQQFRSQSPLARGARRQGPVRYLMEI